MKRLSTDQILELLTKYNPNIDELVPAVPYKLLLIGSTKKGTDRTKVDNAASGTYIKTPASKTILQFVNERELNELEQEMGIYNQFIYGYVRRDTGHNHWNRFFKLIPFIIYKRRDSDLYNYFINELNEGHCSLMQKYDSTRVITILDCPIYGEVITLDTPTHEPIEKFIIEDDLNALRRHAVEWYRQYLEDDEHELICYDPDAE